MILALILAILLILITLVLAVIGGGIMFILKFGWVIICVLLIVALVKYLKNNKK